MSSSSSQEAQEPQECIVSIRLHDGTPVKAKFRSDMTLVNIANYVHRKAIELGVDKKPGGKIYHAEGSFELHTTYPKVIFTQEQFPLTTLASIGMVPSGSLVVVKNERSNVVIKEHGTITEARNKVYLEAAAHRLKGESMEVKEKFKREQALREAEEKRKEKEQKKKDLEKLRQDIEIDKLKRNERDWIPDEYKKKHEKKSTDVPELEYHHKDKDV